MGTATNPKVRAPNGAGSISTGYKMIHVDGELILEHVHIAEQVLGKKLPPGAVVHHANGDKLDNRKENLVICPSVKYHSLIHTRMKALEECGEAHWRKCQFCRQYDLPENIYAPPNGRGAYHRKCKNEDQQVRRASRKKNNS